jgi:protein-S-isoprenylcysteine O-methyltransferase Ste14
MSFAERNGGDRMNRTLALLYGVVSYLVFFATILYLIGFVGDLWVPRSVDRASSAPTGEAAIVNVILMALFAVQHTIMARPAFKRWWTRIVPQPVERSTFVLIASLLLILLFWQWRAMPQVIWDVQAPAGRAILHALFAVGWLMVFAATFMIDHFDLFGLRQVWLHFRGRPYAPPQFQIAILYRWVRHPLMLGFLIAFWATPRMTAGHLLFAAVMTAYILIAIQIEERDLLVLHGEAYAEYRRKTSMIVPLPLGGRVPGA